MHTIVSKILSKTAFSDYVNSLLTSIWDDLH